MNRSILGMLGNIVVTLLLLAIGLKIAVNLVESIMPQLLIGTGVFVVVYLAIVVAQFRRSGW